MGQKQQHRGEHPQDRDLFAEAALPVLCDAVQDMSFLLTRGYADKAALKLVGDHYQLHKRQRMAVKRCACSDGARAHRRTTELPPDHLQGKSLCVDGYNLLISAESALSGGVLLRGRDGCIRDMASVHGSYHRVEETPAAIERLGALLQALGVKDALWYFDAPVSNSGKLKTLMNATARARGWPWTIELRNNPDTLVAESKRIAVTGDSGILNRTDRWCDIFGAFVESLNPEPRVVDLASEPESETSRRRGLHT